MGFKNQFEILPTSTNGRRVSQKKETITPPPPTTTTTPTSL